MSGPVFGERLLRLVMRVHPPEFRREYVEEMIDYYRTVVRTDGATRGIGWRVLFLSRSVRAAARHGVRQRLSAGGWVQRGSGGGSRRASIADTLALDCRHALRSLARRRGFAAAVVGVLAIGMGANTAVFGVLNAVVLRPLPYPESERLVRIYQLRPGSDEAGYVTAPAFVDLRDNTPTLAAVGAVYTYAETGADLTGAGEPVRVRTLRVTAGYFDVLSIRGIRGRPIGEDETVAGATAVVVSANLAGSRGVEAGESIVLDGTAHEVVGVLPAGFEDPLVGYADVLVPLVIDSGDWEDWQWDNHYLTVIARMEPGMTTAAANADVERRYAVLAGVSPIDDPETGRVVSLHADVVGSADTLLALLMGAVGFLLLVACVNVASLFLARGAAREQEMAVRTALGSPRWRVMRQLLIEAVLLSLAGAFSGVLVGRALAGGLVALSPLDLPGGDALPFDGWVFGFSIMMGLVAGLVFGLLPALAATGGRVERLLRQSGRGGGPGERESRTRDVLVVAQLALSLVLLSGAGLLMRSLQNLRSQDLGFRAAGVMTFEVNLPLARYDAGARARFHEELHDRLGAIPGVRAVAAVSRLPVTGRTLSWGVRRVTGDGSAMEPHVSADQRAVQGDYFGLARIPVRAGRAFGPQDRAGAPGRVVISESLARMLFPEGDAMGGRISVAGDPLEIIGVVGDVAVDARGEVAPVVYHAHHQFADNRNWSMRQLVAVDGTVPGLMDAVRHALATIDPALVLHRPAPFDSVIRRDTATDRFVTLLLAAFAGLAVLLAAVGVYGVLAWSVSRRRHEIGVRMALGARATDIRGMIVRRGVLLVVASLGLGLAGAFALTRLLDAFLFGVGVRDPLTFALASGVIGAVALTASLVPAISATRVDPVSAFRSD